MRRASRGRLEAPVSRSEVAGYAVDVLVEVVVVVGCAADCGCEGCEAGGELVCAALAVAGGVLMPLVSGAGDAMVECGGGGIVGVSVWGGGCGELRAR